MCSIVLCHIALGVTFLPYSPFMFLVLLAEFSTSPSSSGTGGGFVGGNFDGATVGVDPGAGVVTTGVVTAGVVATVTFSGVVGFGASVGFVTGARKVMGNKFRQYAKKYILRATDRIMLQDVFLDTADKKVYHCGVAVNDKHTSNLGLGSIEWTGSPLDVNCRYWIPSCLRADYSGFNVSEKFLLQ